MADAAADERPDTRGVKGDIGWVSPAVLDVEAVGRLRSSTLQLPLPWVLDPALAQAWLRSGPPPPARDNAMRPPLDLAIALVRRHPGTSLVAVGITGLALWWWNRSATGQPSR